MFWIFRKIAIPLIAFIAGMLYQAGLDEDGCEGSRGVIAATLCWEANP
jgi:hypothetical protein